jgi:hypothetical protein
MSTSIVPKFWIRWCLATILGFSGGMAIAAVIAGAAEIKSLGLLSCGILGGTAQWFVLRKHIENSLWWIAATALGLMLAFGMGIGSLVACMALSIAITGWASPGVPMPGPISYAIAIIVAGASFGLLQWLFLQGQVARPSGWLLVNTISWFLGGSITTPLFLDTSISGKLGENQLMVLITVIMSSITGAITGRWLHLALDSRTWNDPDQRRGGPI